MPETPTYLLPTAAQNYPSAEELLESAGGLVECNVTVPFWRRADGSDVVVRVRGLDTPTQEEIRLLAARAVDPQDRARGVTRHGPTFAAATLARGLTAPVLNQQQAAGLVRGRHAASVELLVNFIWAISAVDQEAINAIVAGEAAADLEAATAALDDRGVEDRGEPAAE